MSVIASKAGRSGKLKWLRKKGDPAGQQFFLICTLNAEGSPQNIYIYILYID